MALKEGKRNFYNKQQKQKRRKIMEMPKNALLSAADVIAGVEKRIRGGKWSKNMEIMIRILSEKDLLANQLIEELKKTEYDFRGAGNMQIRQRLRVVRDYGILSCQDGRFFIKDTKADPKIQDRVSRAGRPAKEKTGKPRSLRRIMYEILFKKPLPANRLTARVKNHPDYNESQEYVKNLLVATHRALYEGRVFFERENPRRFSCWRVKAGSSPPPAGSRQKFRSKQDDIYRIMRLKFVIKGWSYLDLYEEMNKPDSGYQVKPGSSRDSVVAALYQIFARAGEGYFEKILSDGEPNRWRARWIGPQKVPSCPEEFKDLAMKVMNDLIFPLSLDDLLKAVRQHGYLFGYIVNELPATFLENNIARVIAGTKYARRIWG